MDPSTISQEQLKQQANQIGSMSDDQLKAAAAQASQSNPMMRGMNMDPAMMRQASEMMKNMSPEQIAQMQKQAASMMGGGGMPGMGGMPPQPQQPAASTLSAADQKDFAKAEALKNEAAKLVQAKDHDGACLKYFAAINTIRLNDSLKTQKEGKTLEIACRSNIAHCKIQTKEFDQVVDQCEKVLDAEPNNAKCQFRMATAIWNLNGENRSDSEVKSAFKFITKARQAMQADKNIQVLHEEIKLKHEALVKREKQAQEETKEGPKTSTRDKLLSRVIIGDGEVAKDDEPTIEEVKPQAQSYSQQQTFQPPMQSQNPGASADIQKNIDMISGMGDDQLNNMVNMMKSNPAMMRQQYESLHGVKFTDAQFEQMMQNMSPDAIRQGTSMARNNPEMMRRAQELNEKQRLGQPNQTQLQPEPAQQVQTAGPTMQQQQQQMPQMPMMGANGMPDMSNMAEMMNNPMMKEMMNNPEMIKMAQQMMGGGGPGAAAQDPAKMQEMMQNPSMSKLLENPDFLKTSIEMLKSPMAKGQLDAIAQQTGMSSANIIRCLEWLVSFAGLYNRVKPVLPIIKYGLIILIGSYVLKWLGLL